ncbi:MAG: hypothetical protein IJI92_05630 [Erysipelotrichaceae bacterium]|nr:hypothetical protein [Erysipelotrichaceae bacterium]
MKYRYITAGISIINDIKYADGRTSNGKLGGCFVFAYDGIALFSDEVIPVSSGGPDYWDYYGEYFKDNDVPTEGIYLTMPKTHHTLLKYEQSGAWKEESLWGNDYFTLQKENCRTSYRKLQPFLNKDVKGIYLDSNADEDIFEEIEMIREKAPAVKIMWEPPTMSSKDPSLHDRVLNDLHKIDFYSMNLDEASSFFGSSDREEVIRKIIALKIPCFLREGENGSTWIEDGRSVYLKALDPEKAVDVTGCGNCSAAAALYWRLEGKSFEDIVLNANVAAALCARSDGPVQIRKAREEKVYLKLCQDYAEYDMR